MEYDRKNNTLDVSDCSFQESQTLDALYDILKPAIKNVKIQFFKILMTKVQYDWYIALGGDPIYEGREIVEKT